MKALTLLSLLAFAPLAHADFGGCHAVSIGLFSSQTYSSCWECKQGNNYCREICSTIQYTCTSKSSSSSVAPWLDGTATDESQARAAAQAVLNCIQNMQNAGGSAICNEATCVAGSVDGDAHDCR